jgi:hypothetical protein
MNFQVFFAKSALTDKPSWIVGMSILELDVGDLRASSVKFTATELIVTLADGRKIVTPLAWYPRLQQASPAQRANYEIMPMGIHWPAIDEDLSIAGMLKGRSANSRLE